ncbi:MAG: Tol-Pal system protein TolB [Campylobacteraceae bacterium]|jgi:TolB protein|nr:Tol-Pal system protein TolB [Campylobacteraceae bacterium]
MKKLFIFLISTVTLFAADATVEIIKRMDKPPVIQIQDASDSAVSNKFRNNLFKLLLADLKITTYYDVNEAYEVSSFDSNTRAGHGANIKTDLLLKYQITEQLDNSIVTTTKLINAKTGNLISQRNFKISKVEHYPFMSHSIIMNVVKDTNQEPVDWMDKYVIFAKTTAPGKSEIIIADYTLTFQQTIVKGGLNVFPKWADKNQNHFYYTSIGGRKPTIYKVSLMSGQREEIISGEGMLTVSDVSSDENKLLLTMAPNEQPDIYLYNLVTKKLDRITNYRGVDVGGNFVDDEKRVVFISDRLGYPNVFSKKISGDSSVEQMVYLGRNNSSASAYKNYIAYSGRDKASEFGEQTFNLYLISTQTSRIRQLTSTGKNIFPRFSQDGGSVLFIKEYAKESALGIIRLGANKSFHFPINIGKIQSLDW